MKIKYRDHRHLIPLLTVLFIGTAILFHSCKSGTEYKAMILTGQNSYDWETSSEAIAKILENSGCFSVERTESPAEGEDMSGFTPGFSGYDLVVLNYNGDHWPEETKSEFVEYVRSGGGVIVYHSANRAFPDWKEYNEIIGLSGWGNRDEESGPFCYWEDGETIKDNSAGPAGIHVETGDFLVVHREPEHPILKGLPESWLHGNDELYGALRGPARNMTILATAYSDTARGGTGRNEPVLFTISYGTGRIFHITLGHPGDGSNTSALHCAGFITILQRGAEWAVTGQVTQSVHPDLPNSASTFFWEDFRPLTLEELMENISSYEIGKSRKYLADLSNRIRKSDGTAETLLNFEKAIVEVCNSEATAECKKYLCRELSWMGSDYCIPTLHQLAENPETAEMANYALTRLQK